MRLRVLLISFLLLAALAATCHAQQANATGNYSGTAKLVLKLEQMPEQPAMPDNPAKGLVPTTFGMPVAQSGSTAAFDQTSEFAEFAMPAAPATPSVPQGTILQATVLYSSDPAIKVNDTYTLKLDYDSQSMPYGLKDQLLDDLNPGTIVGINDYTLDGSTIKVDVGTAYWKKKIFIEGSPGSGSSQSRNPFRMDLTFRPFRPFTDFWMGDNTSSSGITAPPIPMQNSTPSTFQNLGFYDIIGRFLG